jgi:hypothetical protein
MKLPVVLHVPSIMVGLKLRGLQRKIFRNIKRQIDAYIGYFTLRESCLREIVGAFNETIDIGIEESIPLCKQVIKYLRHKLCDCGVEGFRRIVHLLNALMINSGIRAHVLIGHLKFLRTITFQAVHCKLNPSISHQAAADFAYKCLESWTLALHPRKDLFPFYQQTFDELQNRHLFSFNEEPCFILTSLELSPIEIDPTYRSESRPVSRKPSERKMESKISSFEPFLPELNEIFSTSASSRPSTPNLIDGDTNMRTSNFSFETAAIPRPSMDSDATTEIDGIDDVLSLSPVSPVKECDQDEEPPVVIDDRRMMEIADPKGMDTTGLSRENSKKKILSPRSKSGNASFFGSIPLVADDGHNNSFFSLPSAGITRMKRKKSSFCSDLNSSANVQIRFYGNHRVVISQKDVLSSSAR